MYASAKITLLKQYVQCKNETIHIAEILLRNGELNIEEFNSIRKKISDEFEEKKRAVLFPGFLSLHLYIFINITSWKSNFVSLTGTDPNRVMCPSDAERDTPRLANEENKTPSSNFSTQKNENQYNIFLSPDVNSFSALQCIDPSVPAVNVASPNDATVTKENNQGNFKKQKARFPPFMHNLPLFACNDYPQCKQFAIYSTSPRMEGAVKYCAKHKPQGSVLNKVYNRCHYSSCHHCALYRYEDKKVREGKEGNTCAKKEYFCTKHRQTDMTAIFAMCEGESCQQPANYRRRCDSYPRYCAVHSTPDMEVFMYVCMYV